MSTDDLRSMALDYAVERIESDSGEAEEKADKLGLAMAEAGNYDNPVCRRFLGRECLLALVRKEGEGVTKTLVEEALRQVEEKQRQAAKQQADTHEALKTGGTMIEVKRAYPQFNRISFIPI